MELVVNPPQQVFDQLIHWAAVTHGWGHMPYDYQFYAKGFDGYWFICVVDPSKDDSTNFVAGGSLARCTDGNGNPLYSIGLFYCQEEYRGQGYGKPVFKAMMDIVGEDNCVLMAAPDMSQKYADIFGFKEMPVYWHHKLIIVPSRMDFAEKISDEYITKNWTEVDPDQLNVYDKSVCFMDRKNRMQLWFSQHQVYTKVAFDSNQNIMGYCTIRVVNLNRLVVDPFYAENPEVAVQLLTDVCKMIPDFETFELLLFRFPEINEGIEVMISQLCPIGSFTIRVANRTQFTRKLLESRDEVVYSVACTTHGFV
ncbi:hypothetical protein L5515_006411 [Caenorhabditis briggsae]|uniref:N-acetyltransferase domain-containing protein n=2 Tax=Caenorhabditis briggsae TaxID=6238 RepID=A0AAE9F0N6_CAEBR|nr:hypothetical protein L5515_006411 [Caenorhabditis briggsae]